MLDTQRIVISEGNRMSAEQQLRQADRKRGQRVDAEKKAGDLRKKESDKRVAATKARLSAAKTTSASQKSSKLREADRYENDANRAAQDAASWQRRAAGYLKEESDLLGRAARAEQMEAAAAERKRKREQQAADRTAAAKHADILGRVTASEDRIESVLRGIRAPKTEKLRILMLGASPEGDLRIGREQKRIRSAVQKSLHRDLVELDVRTSATTTDLLEGITGFRPHVVHFSGHSNDDLVVFDEDVDSHNYGVVVSAQAFANAVAATDDPPLLVLLNSCNSAQQIDDLVESVTPFAIGMSAEIEDGDAITYAAQFYAAMADGQSIYSSHASGQAALELAGLSGHELPTLACSDGVNPRDAVLVTPPEAQADDS